MSLDAAYQRFPLLSNSQVCAGEHKKIRPRTVGNYCRARCLAHGQQLELQAEAPCPTTGNEALLAVLLRNLVDNALRYSPAGSTVRVRAALQQGVPALQVDDSGPGMSDADRARLGERFFRVPGHDAPGSGLGWSIVRRIAQAHGLQLQVQPSAELGGLSVQLRWPPGEVPSTPVPAR